MGGMGGRGEVVESDLNDLMTDSHSGEPCLFDYENEGPGNSFLAGFTQNLSNACCPLYINIAEVSLIVHS